MKSSWSLAVSLGLLTVALTPPAHAEGLAATGMTCGSDLGLPCRYWVPAGYDASKKYPLVLYMHGAGQSGTNNTSQVDEWGNLPGGFLETARRAKYGYFFVAPQAPRPEGADRWVNWDWSQGSYDYTKVEESNSLKKAMDIVKWFRAQYNIDPDRIYVAGESMGGFGTWDALARHPDVFAAGIPTDGGGSPQAATTLATKAILSAHFDGDGAVPVSSDQEMYQKLTSAGARQTYLQIAGQNHGVAGVLAGDDTVYEWLFSQRKGAPSTAPLSFISFSNPGGASDGPVTVTIKTAIEGGKIRYTTDGSLPGPNSGMDYSGPVTLSKSAILQAAVLIAGEEGGTSYYRHAATYVIAGQPVPGTVDMSGPSTGGQGGGANTGGQAGGSSGAGGASTGGGGSGSGGRAAGSSGSAGAGGSSSGSGNSGGTDSNTGGGASSGGASGGAGSSGAKGGSTGSSSGGRGGSSSGSGGDSGGDSSRPTGEVHGSAGCSATGGGSSGQLGAVLMALFSLLLIRRFRPVTARRDR